jgi:hypothetical protein
MSATSRSERRRQGGEVAPEPSSKGLFGSIVDHGEESLLSGSYFDRPYPHLTFEKFFADDVYRLLIANWPDLDRYVDLNGARTRKQFTLYDRKADAGDPKRTELWRTVCDALSAPAIEAALRERLRRGLEIRARGGDEDWPIPMFPQPVLYADLDGYAIKPHTDTRRKALTMLIYMPDDDGRREFGTTIYKISPMSIFAWKTYGLVKEKRVPFLPNSGYAFVVISPAHSLLHASWHGRAAISVDNAKPRKMILNAYYAKPPQEEVVTDRYA